MTYTLDTRYQSKSYDCRERFLVIHYTAGDFQPSLETLTSGKVSVHYLVPEEAIEGKPGVYQLLPEKLRAWHAGVSYWQGRSNLNDTSIGIEIVNRGYEVDAKGAREWCPFTDYQIDIVTQLAKDIIERYQMKPDCVVGHVDIAPQRKEDPGPLFPWKKLADAGVGAWYEEEAIQNELLTTKSRDWQNIALLQQQCAAYGYSIEQTGVFDSQTQHVLQAFQMHFRPASYTGKPDLETYLILKNLIERYRQIGS